MKHKHYDCIVAWAEGKNIEYYCPLNKKWFVTTEPKWHLDFEYRIKKEPVIEVKYFYKTSGGYQYSEFISDLEKWDLKITCQDGKAIKAEVAE